MIQTSVYKDGYDFYVSLTLHGEQVDEAGPFDDRLDAELAAQRMAPVGIDFDHDERDWLPSWSGSWNSGRYLGKRDRRLAERRAAGAA